MKVKLLRAASEDLILGHRFYENQSPGVGEYFLDSLFSDVDSLVLNAGIHPVCPNGYHRMLSKRFPYSIYYRVEEDMAVVYAIVDSRQDPAAILRRLT